MSKLDDDHPRDVAEEQLDDWLRTALDDRTEVARRVARQALESAGPSPAHGSRRWRPVGLTAAAALLLALLAWWPASPPQHLPQPETSPPRAESLPAAPAELRLSNENGLVTVTSSAGSQWIILPGAAS